MSKHIQYGKNLAFCLHIPDERQGYVLCYSLYENDELRIFVNHGQEQFHLSSLDMAGSVLKVCVNLLGKVFLHL